jgi:hypothetical protein
MIFNTDMTARLAALQEAAEAGEQVHARYLAPTHGADYETSQPGRVTVHLSRGRTVVLAAEMAAQVADQLDANGYSAVATTIRAEAAKAG